MSGHSETATHVKDLVCVWQTFSHVSSESNSAVCAMAYLLQHLLSRQLGHRTRGLPDIG